MLKLSRLLVQTFMFGVALAKTAGATTVLAPWAMQATGWVTTLTSIWVPLIFAVITIGVLVVSRYMGDRDDWISSLLTVAVKASLAANALTIVGYFVGAATVPAATLDEVFMMLEDW